MTNYPQDPYGQAGARPPENASHPSPYEVSPRPANNEHSAHARSASDEPDPEPNRGRPKKRSRWIIPVLTGVLAFTVGIAAGGGSADDGAAASGAELAKVEAERDAVLEELEVVSSERDELAAEMEAASGSLDVAEELEQVTAERDELAGELETMTDERDAALAAAEEAEGQIAAAEEAEADAAAAAAERSFGNGTWRVGEDIDPGVYRTEGASSCYWERLSGFSGEFGDIIANDFTSGPTTVTIAASDSGFSSQGCGTWELQE
ncbi:hypothetical protein [Pseudactinotalea sp. Z1748]|uniref:hypothetical protein n=1 Tax=Pseudactinotalea sp. Z1748 TaxID=3413027 RepID=UPI003C7DFE86